MTKKRQLIAQCKDMIHIAPDAKAPLLFGEKVSFLHRTVVDYIYTDHASAYLRRLAGDFDPKKLLFDASLGQCRALMGQHRLAYLQPRLREWTLACLFYAHEIEVAMSDEPCEQVNAGLDELEMIIARAFWKWGLAEGIYSVLGERYSSLVQLGACCDLATYVRCRLPQCTSDTLDEVAIGWRTPYQIAYLSDFYMERKTESNPWRLGQMIQLEDDPENSTQPPEHTRSLETNSSKTLQHGIAVQAMEPRLGPRTKTRRRLLRKVAHLFR